jgi:hypothetical protein
MRRLGYGLFVFLLIVAGHFGSAQAPRKYPPLTDYMMPRDAEISMAKSAAPAKISDRATIKILTTSGFQDARATPS